MKKILLLFLMFAMLPKAAGAQTPTDDTFTVSDLQTDKYGTFFIVSLNADSRLYSAYNMDLKLPSGITIATYKDSYDISMLKTTAAVYPKEEDEREGTITYTHSISFNYNTSENSLRLECHSSKSESFTKAKGDLFKVYVNIDESAFTSSFSPKPIVKLSGLNLTTSAAVKYVPADFACRPFTTGIPTARTLPVNVSAANKVGTLILPFDAELPSGLKAYSCDATEGDLLTLTPAESLEACTPYIVYAENGYSGNLSGTAKLPDASNVTDVFTDGLLTGLLTSGVVNTGFILQNKGEGPIFYDAEGVNFSLPAGRCYLTSSAGSVKAFQFAFDDADGIEMVNGKSVNGKLFDLSGRKIERPSRGIYIQGTRKVVIK